MKILELPEVTSLDDDQVLIVDGGGLPTSKIKVGNVNFGSSGGGDIISNPDDKWVYHRNTYRGKNLGTVFTDEQKAAIKNGTFDDLFVGDYWTIGGFDWLIADINYWLNTGYTPEHKGCTEQHLVIVPRKSLYSAGMESTTTTANGYLGSAMYKTGLNQAKTIIKTAFGEKYILTHNDYFSNAASNGVVTGHTWVDTQIDLMTQFMVFGSAVIPRMLSSATNASGVVANHVIDFKQLSLFDLNKRLIIDLEMSYWLRDIASSGSFVTAGWPGGAAQTNANNLSTSMGVRPAFGLIGE